MVLSTKNFYNNNQLNLNSFQDVLDFIYGNQKHEDNMYITFMDDEIDSNMKSYVKGKITQYRDILYNMSSMMHRMTDLSYHEYKIPKKKGGFRDIAEPNAGLKEVQKQLYIIFLSCHIFPNEKAYAYIENRGIVDMANEHKHNKYIVKMDLKNFFPSITEELLKKVLLRNYAFQVINELVPNFVDELVRIACYKGSLPQGSPLSPYLSNLVMIEFDYLIRNSIGHIKYTRYADDMIFSSSEYISPKSITLTVEDKLIRCFNSAISLNKEKTKVLKTTGRCYVVGVKINKENEISYGHEKKKKLKFQLYNMFKAYEQDKDSVPKEQIQETLGLFSYMKQIEPNYAKYLERKLLNQFNSTQPTLGKHFKY